MNGLCDDCADKKKIFKENFLDLLPIIISILYFAIAIPIAIIFA